MFDDCKGDKFQELLASFSTIVLRKVLAEGQAGKASIAGRFAVASRVTRKEHESFLPLAIAHRSSLTALLERKKELRARYKDFKKALELKDQALDQKFQEIVQTQGFLDDNPIPDHIASRVSKIVEKHWQSDARLVDVIAQGEERGVRDSLLDVSYSDLWPQVSAGTFGGPTGVSRHGLLEDLEKRVADQETRLNQWKDFKVAMERDIKSSTATSTQSPAKLRPKAFSPGLQRQRDAVFSPRKSPRKSHWENIEEESPSLGRAKSSDPNFEKDRGLVFSPRKSPRKSDWGTGRPDKQMSPSTQTPTIVNNGDAAVANPEMSGCSCDDEMKDRALESRSKTQLSGSTQGSSQYDSDHSGFSEISGGHLHYGDSSADSSPVQDSSNSGQNENIGQENSEKISPKIHDKHPSERDQPNSSKKDGRINEDDLLAEQIVTMTVNAAPTPAKPKLSLVERTRQSIMALASPSGLQRLTTDDDEKDLTSPVAFADKRGASITQLNGPTTLLERTRQSISLVPARPPGSRKSMHDRRTSKVYPTNQFETPRKQMSRIKELTPPEELFSPGAGYESVFKSRPKVGFSPVASPVPDETLSIRESQGEGSLGESVDDSRWEESPLAKASAKV